MRGRNRIQRISIFFLVFGFVACQVKRPKEILPDAKMENVLYDYHIAKAMGEEVPYSESYKRLLYIESVFRKHGITQAEFDSSMVWFARNPEVLSKIYEKVSLRLKAERDGINQLIAIRDNKPKESQPGDSIDVWIGQRIYRLTGMHTDNKLVFTLPSDSNFQERDTLCWNVCFNFRKGVPDSLHRPVMSMQIKYESDSTIRHTLNVEGSGWKTICLSADTLGKIKEIAGFVYYPMQQSSRTLLISNVSLMRYHATDSLILAPKDSIRENADKVEGQTEKKALKELKPVKLPEQHKEEGFRRGNARPRPALREADKPVSTLREIDRPTRSTEPKR